MSAREFVRRIRDEVVEGNWRTYKEQLLRPKEKIRDSRWRTISAAYERMDDSQREAVNLLARQVIIDTVANILGILDGSSLLSGYREHFSLEYGVEKERLNGDLQDIFLSDED